MVDRHDVAWSRPFFGQLKRVVVGTPYLPIVVFGEFCRSMPEATSEGYFTSPDLPVENGACAGLGSQVEASQQLRVERYDDRRQ